MFLPVLLVREMGFWGWVVFAVPNVVGAAAMGWVLRDAAASTRLVETHRLACAAFSAITIMFQVSFVGWIVVLLIGHWAGFILLGAIIVVLIASRLGRAAELVLATLVFAASLTAFCLAIRYGHDIAGAGFPPATARPPGNLVWVALVCLFGFLLCPYFDLTFHRVHQTTGPGAAKFAFAFGFGGPFLLMIVFTLWYARLLIPLSLGGRAVLPDVLRWLIAGHMSMQCGYTVGVHWRALGLGAKLRDNPGRLLGAILGFVAGLVPPLVGGLGTRLDYTGLTRGEIVYRLFLAFYGLVFPAYAWLCMIPARGATAPTRRQIRVFVLALLIAGPMFWMGFIERHMIWLGPGVGVVLLLRLLLVRDRSNA